MRLDKFLTEVQIGSRSQVKDYIKKGRISVNQVTVLKPEAQIKENSDTVTFDGKELQYSQFHYYMLHKPAGVITAVKDDKDVTVMSLLPIIMRMICCMSSNMLLMCLKTIRTDGRR